MTAPAWTLDLDDLDTVIGFADDLRVVTDQATRRGRVTGLRLALDIISREHTGAALDRARGELSAAIRDLI